MEESTALAASTAPTDQPNAQLADHFPLQARRELRESFAYLQALQRAHLLAATAHLSASYLNDLEALAHRLDRLERLLGSGEVIAVDTLVLIDDADVLLVLGILRHCLQDTDRRWRAEDGSTVLLLNPDERVLAVLRPSSPAASSSDLDALATLQPAFPDLIPAIQQTGRWAYQEAIAPRLIDDLAGSCPPRKAG